MYVIQTGAVACPEILQCFDGGTRPLISFVVGVLVTLAGVAFVFSVSLRCYMSSAKEPCAELDALGCEDIGAESL